MTTDLISRQAVLDAINSYHQITHIRAAMEAIPAADVLSDLQAENQRLRGVLEKIAATGRCEFATVRAALRSTREDE